MFFILENKKNAITNVGDHRHYMSKHMYTTVKSLNRIHKSHKKQNTCYCRWLNMLKFMCFLTDLKDPRSTFGGAKLISRTGPGHLSVNILQLLQAFSKLQLCQWLPSVLRSFHLILYCTVLVQVS